MMKVVSPSWSGQLRVSSSMINAAALEFFSLALGTATSRPSGVRQSTFAPQFIRGRFFAALLSSAAVAGSAARLRLDQGAGKGERAEQCSERCDRIWHGRNRSIVSSDSKLRARQPEDFLQQASQLPGSYLILAERIR